MNRKATRRQVEAAVRPMLTKGEELRRSGPAWAVERRGKAPLLFRARDLHEVVLTDQRLILLTRPRRRRPLGVNNLVLAKRYSTFSLERARRLRPMLQLRVRTSAERVLVLEFRPRDRGLARDLTAAMGPPKRGRADPVAAAPVPTRPEPVTPEPVRFEPPEPEPVRFEPPEPEPVRFEPPSEPEEETGGFTEKRSSRRWRRPRKEAKRADGEKESRRGGDRRQAWEGPPGGFERRRGEDRRSDWDDAKPSRKERRQARKERKKRDRTANDIDITEQLRQ